MSPTERTKVRDALAGAFSVDEVNQLGRATGQAVRLRLVAPHRLRLAVVAALASGRVESLADLLRALNHQHGDVVACKALCDVDPSRARCPSSVGQRVVIGGPYGATLRRSRRWREVAGALRLPG